MPTGLNNRHGHSYRSTTTRIFWGYDPDAPRLSDNPSLGEIVAKSFIAAQLSVAVAGFLISGESLAY